MPQFKSFNEVGKKYGMGSGWMKLQDGDNKVRILSEFEDYGSHYNQKTKKSVICLGKENCPICEAGGKPRVQFLGWVIDRKDSNIKLLQIGYQIFQQIGNLSQSEEYSFDSVPDYDMTITKTGQGIETEYAVLPARQNTELTKEEVEVMEVKMKKTPKEIIDGMKAKLGGTANVASEEIPVVEDDGVNVEEIPF